MRMRNEKGDGPREWGVGERRSCSSFRADHSGSDHSLSDARRPTPYTLAYALAFIFLAVAASAQDIVIRDATILTVSHGRIEHGSILVHAGKIAGVGATGAVV